MFYSLFFFNEVHVFYKKIASYPIVAITDITVSVNELCHSKFSFRIWFKLRMYLNKRGEKKVLQCYTESVSFCVYEAWT